MNGGTAMDRRSALSSLAALGASVAWPARAEPARAADFDAAAASSALLAPLKGVSDSSGELAAPALLHGRWPAELQGRFYRNGPALFERAGERYHHWFDGDGMVQQFSIGAGQVLHRGRLVRTSKLAAEQQAGRFLLSALGTSIEGRAHGSGPDSFNTANTNALEHEGQLLALWEGGSAYAMDPADLSTRGPVTWRADLKGLPFSAHPKVDAAGHLWNIGSAGKHLVVWHINPQGSLASVQLAESPYPGGMVHDMAVSERHIVLPLPPVRLNFEKPALGPRRFALEAGQPLRVLVMDKNDVTKRRVFELPPQFVFHVGNAHDTADGAIELSFIGAPDATFLDQSAVAMMAGRPLPPNASTLQTVRLDLATGRAPLRAYEGDVEFPRIDPRRIGLPVRHIVTTAGWLPYSSRHGAMRHGVQVLDTHSGRTRRFDYGDQTLAEEHVLVPKPGRVGEGRGELDAWLLGTTYDARRRATVLNLLDAAHVEDGPIAQAVLPYMLPLGFHGNFTAA